MYRDSLHNAFAIDGAIPCYMSHKCKFNYYRQCHVIERKGLEGKRDDRSLDNYALYDCYFAYMTLKQNGLKRFVPGSILAGIALIT